MRSQRPKRELGHDWTWNSTSSVSRGIFHGPSSERRQCRIRPISLRKDHRREYHTFHLCTLFLHTSSIIQRFSFSTLSPNHPLQPHNVRPRRRTTQRLPLPLLPPRQNRRHHRRLARPRPTRRFRPLTSRLRQSLHHVAQSKSLRRGVRGVERAGMPGQGFLRPRRFGEGRRSRAVGGGGGEVYG